MDSFCPLCNSQSKLFFESKKLYNICLKCSGIFVHRNFLPSYDNELLRYKKHNNDVNDLKYQAFVYPIVKSVLNEFSENNKGLDFGAGTGPVISKLLKEKKYNIKEYDPFFKNDPELLENKYDYIICCEVIEHFHNPQKEFKLLNSILNKNGILYCMTSIYKKDIDFKNWYYKNDLTHVFFYQKETIEFIKEYFKFKYFSVDNNLIKFFKE